MQVSAGTQLGPYKIISLLGSGGMGAVYLASDPRLDRKVAIKVLTRDRELDQDALARFEREGKAIAALSHSNILAIYDIGVHEDLSYIVTEYLEGETLRNRLNKSVLPWRKAIEIAVAVADGLASAHSKGIIHRDLKPENIFLTAEDHVKILDFGLAKLTAKVPSSEMSALQTQPQTGADIIMGTMHYMSPEQARGEPLDARSDIYSLGCVLQEMITGQRVFQRNSSAETIAAILKEEPPHVSASVPVPPELDRLIFHCLEKDPERRFQSSRDLTFELKQILSSSATSSSYAFTEQVRMEKRRQFPFWVLAIAVLAIAGAAIYYWQSRDTNTSIAVLPFVNESGDLESEYFSDGITESLINNLSRLPQLKVIARTSAFRYKGKQTDPLHAGKELGVKNVLTGRVLQRGEMLIVQADLIDVNTGSQLWGERFNRKFSDVFSIQDGISREISDKLRLRLTDQQEHTLQKRQTASLDAYQLYLKGRFFWNKRTPRDVQKALEFYKQAIGTDPEYAQAYVGIGECLAIISQFADTRILLPQAKEMAMKALEIDPQLGEAHSILAFFKTYQSWDWKGAEQEFQTAIRMNPNYATTYHWYGLHLCALGRFDEAKAQFNRALQIDPLSLMVITASATPYTHTKDYERMKAIAQKVVELDPNFMPGVSLLSNAYYFTGDLEKSSQLRIKAMRMLGEDSIAEQLEKELQQKGPTEMRRKMLEILETEAPSRKTPWLLAVVYSTLQDKEKTLYWLQKAYDEHNTEIIFLRVDPMYEFLHKDPRFQKMVEGLNFPKP